MDWQIGCFRSNTRSVGPEASDRECAHHNLWTLRGPQLWKHKSALDGLCCVCVFCGRTSCLPLCVYPALYYWIFSCVFPETHERI